MKSSKKQETMSITITFLIIITSLILTIPIVLKYNLIPTDIINFIIAVLFIVMIWILSKRTE